MDAVDAPAPQRLIGDRLSLGRLTAAMLVLFVGIVTLATVWAPNDDVADPDVRAETVAYLRHHYDATVHDMNRLPEHRGARAGVAVTMGGAPRRCTVTVTTVHPVAASLHCR